MAYTSRARLRCDGVGRSNLPLHPAFALTTTRSRFIAIVLVTVVTAYRCPGNGCLTLKAMRPLPFTDAPAPFDRAPQGPTPLNWLTNKRPELDLRCSLLSHVLPLCYFPIQVGVIVLEKKLQGVGRMGIKPGGQEAGRAAKSSVHSFPLSFPSLAFPSTSSDTSLTTFLISLPFSSP